MKEPVISAAADKISQDVVDYVELKTASAKLAIVEGLSTFSGNALRIFVLAIFCMLALMALFTAAIWSLSIWTGSVVWGALIVCGVCLLLGFIFYACRKLFINAMVKTFSEMVFSTPKHDEHEEEA